MPKYYTRFPGDTTELPEVDVAIVMESTYPFLKGGVSAVVHDIITHQPELSFGIIHVAWDHEAPLTALYDVPANVAWVDVLYLSLEEHKDAFAAVTDTIVPDPARAVDALDYALTSLLRDNVEPLWELYHAAVNPATRTWRLWSLMRTREFMQWCVSRIPDVELGRMFWTIRDLFSLAYAVADRIHPPAKVYHAHTTGYVSLIAACAARQHEGSFLLTEHNLYVRDTVNTLLGRNMSQIVTRRTYREVTDPLHRIWTVWWTEMGAMFYPSANAITYLYTRAIEEAQALGGDPSKSIVLSNGIEWERFATGREQREPALKEIAAGAPRQWRFACIARVVPIKGIMELIDATAILRDTGHTSITIDVCGPTEHVPDYAQRCREYIVERGLEGVITLRGTVDVGAELPSYDALVLSSFNEGQPVVVLEAMSCGLPVIATDVGGLDHMVTLPVGQSGHEVGPCGVLVQPGHPEALAAELIRLIHNPDLYLTWHHNALARVRSEFLMENIMVRYRQLYTELGA